MPGCASTAVPAEATPVVVPDAVPAAPPTPPTPPTAPTAPGMPAAASTGAAAALAPPRTGRPIARAEIHRSYQASPISPALVPTTRMSARPANRPHAPAEPATPFSRLASTGSTAWLSTSQKRKRSTPIVIALRSARIPVRWLRTLPMGSPRKMVTLASRPMAMMTPRFTSALLAFDDLG